jgi:hypothetical protein
MKAERPPKLKQAGLLAHPVSKPALTLGPSTSPRLPSSEVCQGIKEMMSQIKKQPARHSEPPETAYESE